MIESRRSPIALRTRGPAQSCRAPPQHDRGLADLEDLIDLRRHVAIVQRSSVPFSSQEGSHCNYDVSCRLSSPARRYSCNLDLWQCNLTDVFAPLRRHRNASGDLQSELERAARERKSEPDRPAVRRPWPASGWSGRDQPRPECAMPTGVAAVGARPFWCRWCRQQSSVPRFEFAFAPFAACGRSQPARASRV
jgi:hypothetical protein